MSCIQSTLLVVLINGTTSPFFHENRGLRQGFPLSHLLFLLVVEALRKLVMDAKRRGEFQRSLVAGSLYLTLLIFVNDILIFYNGSARDIIKQNELLKLLGRPRR